MRHLSLFVSTGLAVAVNGFSVYLVLAEQHDPIIKTRLVWLDFGLVLLAIVAFGIYIWRDYREHERLKAREQESDARAEKADARAEKADANLAELMNHIRGIKPVFGWAATTQAQTVEASGLVSIALQQAGINLAKEIRDFENTVPSGLSLEDEHNALFGPFIHAYWSRLHDIKERFKTVLGPVQVVSSVAWLPTSKDNVDKIARNLEREALRVPPNVWL